MKSLRIYLPDQMCLLYSGGLSSCDCLHNTCTRCSLSKIHHGIGRGLTKPLSSWGMVTVNGCWERKWHFQGPECEPLCNGTSSEEALSPVAQPLVSYPHSCKWPFTHISEWPQLGFACTYKVWNIRKVKLEKRTGSRRGTCWEEEGSHGSDKRVSEDKCDQNIFWICRSMSQCSTLLCTINI